MKSETVKPVRCATYTRVSTDHGLEQDFNSLHAQREACEAYIKSQKHEGWNALPTAYDDGGYSGGSMERPGLQKLLADIQAGTIDVVAGEGPEATQHHPGVHRQTGFAHARLRLSHVGTGRLPRRLW